jgi:hypothetical protein
MATSHLYARISSVEQRKGGGLERQTSDRIKEFNDRHGFTLNPKYLVDDGVSAFRGLNATPKHALGKFLLAARAGDIPRGIARPGRGQHRR